MNISTLGQGWRQGCPSCSLWWRGCCDWGFAPRQCRFERSQQAQADSPPYCCQQRSSASCQDFTGLWLPPQSPGKVNFSVGSLFCYRIVWFAACRWQKNYGKWDWKEQMLQSCLPQPSLHHVIDCNKNTI